MKIISHVFRYIPWVVPPLLLGLIILYLIATHQTTNITSMLTAYEKPIFVTQEKKLLEGDSVIGSFTASDDYLGTVMVHIYPYREIKHVFVNEQDIIQFRIRESSSNIWYYTNTYPSFLFHRYVYFPFGFPIIPVSKGKSYVFELHSLHGNDFNALSIDYHTPQIMLMYQIGRSTIMKHPMQAANFFLHKLTSDSNELQLSFLIPTIGLSLILLFSIYNLEINILIRKKPHSRSSFWYFVLFLESLVLVTQNLNSTPLILVGVVYITIRYKLKAKVLYALTLCLIISALICTLLGFVAYSDTLSVWIYIFVFLGLILQLGDKIKSII